MLAGGWLGHKLPGRRFTTPRARACGCKEEVAIKHSAVFNIQQQVGATFIEHHGWQVAAYFSSAEREAAQVRESVGVADVSWMVKLDLKGQGLRGGLTLGKRASSWGLGPLHLLVTCDPTARNEVMERLQAFQATGLHVSLPPPVYVTDVTSVYAQFLLAGPESRRVLAKLTSLNLSESSLPDLSCGQSSLAHVHAMILRRDLGGIPAYHLLVSREYGESVWESVLHAGHEFEISPFGLQAHELLN